VLLHAEGASGSDGGVFHVKHPLTWQATELHRWECRAVENLWSTKWRGDTGRWGRGGASLWGMTRMFIGLVFVLGSSQALGQDCVVDGEALVNQFASKVPKGVKLLASKKEKRLVRQSLKLADGTEVAVELSGCERVQYRFSIKSAGLTTRTVGAEALAVARRVLPTLPMSKEALAEPRVLLAAIEESSFTSLPATISCGTSGTCRIELVPDPTKSKKKPASPAPKGKGDEKPAEAPEAPALLVLSYDAPV
jgi:hypothetical protein